MSESIDDRVRCLDTAKGFVTRDRNSSYGNPEDNFANIAAIWSAQGVTVNGHGVTAADVALMMIGMKLARLKHNPTHEDSWIDAAGYAACGMRAANVDAERLNSASLPPEFRAVEGDKTCGDPEPHGGHTWTYEAKLMRCGGYLVEEVVERTLFKQDSERDPNWISPNQCGLRSDHPAHNYKDKSQWCDGYVTNPDRRKVAQDVRAVERVADSGRACGGKEPHHNC